MSLSRLSIVKFSVLKLTGNYARHYYFHSIYNFIKWRALLNFQTCIRTMYVRILQHTFQIVIEKDLKCYYGIMELWSLTLQLMQCNTHTHP